MSFDTPTRNGTILLLAARALHASVEFGLGLTGMTTIPADTSDHRLALVS
jgi:hypothetical protein